MPSSDNPGISTTMLLLVLLVLLAVFLLTAISAPGAGRVADSGGEAGVTGVVADAVSGSCPRGSDE